MKEVSTGDMNKTEAVGENRENVPGIQAENRMSLRREKKLGQILLR